jgi:hypothetical protein
MSFQGTEWAVNVRGVNRGEKAILMQIGHKLDQRTNMARISVPEIACGAEMTERQVYRILDQLEKPRVGHSKGILKRVGGGVGKGNVSIYSFIGFAKKISPPEKVTFPAAKGDISAAKGDIRDSAIRNIRTSEELQEENQLITPNGALTSKNPALSFWLKFKDELLRDPSIPEDYRRWLRPLYFLKELSGGHLLLALPPNNKLFAAYKSNEHWLRERLAVHERLCSATVYPDEWEARALGSEVEQRLYGKKEPQKASA